MPFSRASLSSMAPTSAGSPSTGPYRWSVNASPKRRAASIASGGGPYDTTPCPSEIVPGVSAIQRPTTGMTGVWTAARREDWEWRALRGGMFIVRLESTRFLPQSDHTELTERHRVVRRVTVGWCAPAFSAEPGRTEARAASHKRMVVRSDCACDTDADACRAEPLGAGLVAAEGRRDTSPQRGGSSDPRLGCCSSISLSVALARLLRPVSPLTLWSVTRVEDSEAC